MKKILLYILIFSLFCTLFLGCAKPSAVSKVPIFKYSSPKTTGTVIKTFEHNGLTREYILYIPEHLPENAPLVIGMHGYTSSPWVFKNNFGWDAVAEENKFIMCYPQGTLEPYNNYSHWNARLPISTVDDVGFISDLAMHLAKEYFLDKNRIFATGFSNGGYMAYTLACERPDIFRAVASVSGLMSEYTYQSYNPMGLDAKTWLDFSPSEPIPICHIHGTEDYIVPIDASEYLPEFRSIKSAEDTAKFWARINGCTQIQTFEYTQNVTATHYKNPNGERQVWYYEYEGWSHFWPSKNYPVNMPSEINAQEIIWEFFNLYK